ncbi:MAG: PD-(D/E)XK nuclease family protein [Myxococcota bacterium]
MTRALVTSTQSGTRLVRARAWLAARAPAEPVWVIGASQDASAELIRHVATEQGGAFGWEATTLPRLAVDTALLGLAELGRVPIGAIAAEAVTARVVHRLADAGELGRFREAAQGPGLARALARVLDELAAAGVGADRVESRIPELAAIARGYAAALEEAGLADRAQVERFAADAKSSGRPASLLFLDLPAPSQPQQAWLAALVARAPHCLATLPAGDGRAEAAFAPLLGTPSERLDVAETPLAGLQQHLFEPSAPLPGTRCEALQLLSAPGESRECVEIARRIHAAAAEGVRFDRMAILLRAPEAYGPFLSEALRRAEVPAYFARGTRTPDPSGRALLALLSCAAEGLSARRFAEYLSLGEVPGPDATGAPPESGSGGERWVPPDDSGVGDSLARASAAADPEANDTGGSLPTPRHWERLLVDASVIGGHDRWARRLRGLDAELERRAQALEDPDGPAASRLARDREALARLRDFALPLVADLAALPRSGDWGAWIDALSALATRALRRPERCLAVLAELAPMADVGPVGLREVQAVLLPRLQELATLPTGSRYGRVWVAPIEAARGQSFERVFVPGLAEKVFPKKISEEPILLDAVRAELSPALERSEQRLEAERLALRLAVGAAEEGLVLSFPRLDLEASRPRVPSFYALEALRAAEGELPSWDGLARRAEREGAARLGWPAPEAPEDAIDAAEYDLARLALLDGSDTGESQGAARYLLGANPHLARALRFRARRWLDAWTVADGLVKPGDPGRDALQAHRLEARSFSATALQHYASCPYKFFLYAVCRLAPREAPEPIEELDPLQRGSLVHDTQFELLSELREASLLPVTAETLGEARDALDSVLEKVAAEYADTLAPAIDRVWRDGVEGVRADLREWLRRASLDDSGYVPARFELAFGLPGRREADPGSRDAAVPLDVGVQLRGSIDLVETHAEGRLRVTDHKTGKERFAAGGIVDGGHALQPVLYALAAEQLFPDAAVESGRLYYCTSAGGFTSRAVPLDTRARDSAKQVVDAVGAALDEAFLPAAPEQGACRWCDYRAVCGPYEELRTRRKWQPALAGLDAVRKLA